mgnify:CR=1 FL=1
MRNYQQCACPHSFNPLPMPPKVQSGLLTAAGKVAPTQDGMQVLGMQHECIGPTCVQFEALDDGEFCWELRANKAQVRLLELLSKKASL